MPAFVPGLRLNDRFVLVERIGSGGMSEVWRAQDDVLGRPVAVKALSPATAADPALWQAVLREARAVAQLSHPNVAQVHDYGETGDIPYLVLEYAPGEDLAARLKRGPLPWREAATVARQVAAALAEAHQRGIRHRDVKPANIMLTPTGVKVLDFGIAAYGPGPEGPLYGTPGYAAPEQLSGTEGTPADVYALGIVLHEMLTGRPPWPVNTWEDARSLATTPRPVPPLGVPAPTSLDRLLRACLQPDPAQRPAAVQVAALAAEIAAQPGTTAHPTVTATAAIPTAPMPAAPNATSPHRPPPAAPKRTSIVDYTRPVRRRRRGRFLPTFLVTVIGAAAVLAVMGALSGGPSGSTGTAKPPAATSPSAKAKPRTSPSPSKNPATVADVIGQFENVLDTADLAGAVRDDAAHQLRDKVSDVRKELDRNGSRLPKQVADLRGKIQDLADQGKLNQTTAQILIALLDRIS
ncbi:serine/threonine-protein kinase [Hamadaea tsunoensis]|uniref:serine/threonine-protein kinase n=1 Tax=Hamadaea tsunoensis TaxID=53368 RepID=UPI0003F91953|nr:serine/threonine-protein kinase [Hamadaea tsunoensis]